MTTITERVSCQIHPANDNDFLQKQWEIYKTTFWPDISHAQGYPEKDFFEFIELIYKTAWQEGALCQAKVDLNIGYELLAMKVPL